jgi:hypothetical protein
MQLTRLATVAACCASVPHSLPKTEMEQCAGHDQTCRMAFLIADAHEEGSDVQNSKLAEEMSSNWITQLRQF